jgi:hypothetical protein
VPERKLYSVQWLDARWRVTHRYLTLSVHTAKQDAVTAGDRVARVNQPSALRIYAEDGAVEDERIYGDEHFSSPGSPPMV